MIFNQNYKSSKLPNLPGVGKDKEKMTELLKNYVQVQRDDVDVLEKLQKIVSERIGEEFERVHFHFSGKKSNLHTVIEKKTFWNTG